MLLPDATRPRRSMTELIEELDDYHVSMARIGRLLGVATSTVSRWKLASRRKDVPYGVYFALETLLFAVKSADETLQFVDPPRQGSTPRRRFRSKP